MQREYERKEQVKEAFDQLVYQSIKPMALLCKVQSDQEIPLLRTISKRSY